MRVWGKGLRLPLNLWAVLFAFFLLNVPGLKAQTIWSSDAYLSASERTFAVIDVSENIWQVKLYKQQLGDYQTFIKAKAFISKERALAYLLEYHPDLKAVDKLNLWPIELTPLQGKKSTSGLWRVREEWSDEWERRYSEWIQNEVTPDFFSRYGIATDCADVLIGLRWVFARNHNLPVANTLAATGNLFSQDIILRQWRRLKRHEVWHRDELFKTALNYIMDLTSTRTLMRDSYPVELSEEGLRAGSFILTIGPDSNHIKVISETYFQEPSDIPLYTLASTTPRSRKDMVREVFLDEEWPKEGVKDILALRWPKRSGKSWRLAPGTEHSNYGKEQYSEELRSQEPSFIQFLLKRLKPDFSPQKIVEVAMSDIKDYLEVRKKIVEDGYRYCQKNNCSVGTSAWNDWSTPSRDSKIADKFENYELMLARYEAFYPGLMTSWKNSLKDVSIEIFSGQVSLAAIRYIWNEKLYNSDPSAPERERWGLEYKSFFQTLLSDLQELLISRDEIFKRTPNECGAESSCYPKNSIWLSLNTYYLDEKLLALSSKMQQYCYILQTSECLDTRDELLAHEIGTFAGEASAKEWFSRISFFHSDPRASLEQRWGIQSASWRNLGAFEKLRIGHNSRALFDDHVVNDLLSGVQLAKTRPGEHLFLSQLGDILRVERTNQKLFWLPANSGEWEEFKITGLQSDYDWNLAQLIDYDSGSLLILPIEKRILVVNFRNEGAPNIFELENKEFALSGKYLLGALEQKQFSLVNLESGEKYKITLEDKIKNPLLLEIWGQANGKVLAQYSDRDEDIYRQVAIDLKGQKAQFLASIFPQTKIRFWNGAAGRGLLEHKFNDEYPQIFDFYFGGEEIVRGSLLGNLLDDVSSPYVLIAKGGRWDGNKSNSLYEIARDEASLIMQDSSEQKLTGLSEGFLLLKTGEVGKFFNLREQRIEELEASGDLKLAGRQNSKEVFMLSASEHTILARFKTLLGDYFDYGEVYQVNEEGELKLFFTSPLALRWDEGTLKEWSKRFSGFKVYSGTAIATGIGTGIWHP